MDFISNMKVADSELLDTDGMYRLTDPWRHEWNCGVQVPIKDKRDIRPPDSEVVQEDDEDVHPGPSKNVESYAKQYDADLFDDKWLILFNMQAKKLGLPPLSKITFELAMEQLELASLKRPNHDNTCPNMIEHDDTVCDVCRSVNILFTNLLTISS
uniref:Enhancer of polycomb-like N-terminal domain-containing protein n=1 Tax=Romanomermis culicivorax TaxID=13658 RepID=A0A915J6Z4_ROMCU